MYPGQHDLMRPDPYKRLFRYSIWGFSIAFVFMLILLIVLIVAAF